MDHGPRLAGATAPAGAAQDGAARRMHCPRTGGYDVWQLDGGLNETAAVLARALGERRALVVTTPTVQRLVAEPLVAICGQCLRRSLPTLVISCHEETKTQDGVDAICDAALAAELDRTAVLVGIGGGVCLDLVTMAASAIRRGLAQIRVPTTLIGQVDAGIGIKGALNYRGRKSYLGCYCPPELVLLDPALLAGLPDRHVRAGLAEIVKMAIITDADLFALLEREPSLTAEDFAASRGSCRTILWRSIAALLDEIEPNIFEELPVARLADFGHTFSPLLESASAFTVLHGEAVAIDIALSTELAAVLGILPGPARDRIRAILRRLSLPLCSPLLTLKRCRQAIEAARSHRRGRLNLIVPAAIGQGFCIADAAGIPETALREALGHLSADLLAS